ncbi:hypothetical protein SDC9_188850 [bioreactor metagenome]|uniref:Uncharacterized protein n=1 Tax=bioreactor metagenome TaxID=1076179 RepID=A0A645HQR2_9ZZZZ
MFHDIGANHRLTVFIGNCSGDKLSPLLADIGSPVGIFHLFGVQDNLRPFYFIIHSLGIEEPVQHRGDRLIVRLYVDSTVYIYQLAVIEEVVIGPLFYGLQDFLY